MDIVTGILALSAVVGTVGTVKAARDASKAEDKEQRQQELNTRRSRRQGIRQFQVARAQALSSAVGSGAASGSGAAGGIGSLSSQLGGQLGFSSQLSGLSNQITSLRASSQRNSSIGQLGFTTMNFTANGGIGKIANLLPAANPFDPLEHSTENFV